MKRLSRCETDNEILCKYRSKLKWLILFLASVSLVKQGILIIILQFGDYYCYDSPSTVRSFLFSEINDYTNNKFEYYYHLLYSIYSVPNILIPLITGLLIFKYGYRPMFILFGFFVMCGQFLLSLGTSLKSPLMMIAGRFVFGLGGESLNTTQFCLIVNWFAANEVAFALGICLSFARIGTLLNDIISPWIASV